MVSSVYFTFFNDSVLNPLFIGVVRPWFLPVCSEEVDSVYWSPIALVETSSPMGTFQGAHMILRMLICCFRDKVRSKLEQTYCMSPVGMFHHKGRTQSWRSSQSRTWSISRIGRWYLGPVEVVLYCTVFFQTSPSIDGHIIHIIRTSCHLCGLNGLSVQLDRPAVILSPSPESVATRLS